jgi:hypothetical protein
MSVGVIWLMLAGGLSLPTFLDPLGDFSPLRPFLSPVKPVLFERPMLAWVGGGQPVEPRGVEERDINEVKSTLKSQGLFSNFYKGTSHTSILVKMEMGSIVLLEFEIKLRDRKHGARKLVFRPLRRTKSFYLTLGTSINKVHRVHQPK